MSISPPNENFSRQPSTRRAALEANSKIDPQLSQGSEFNTMPTSFSEAYAASAKSYGYDDPEECMDYTEEDYEDMEYAFEKDFMVLQDTVSMLDRRVDQLTDENSHLARSKRQVDDALADLQSRKKESDLAYAELKASFDTIANESVRLQFENDIFKSKLDHLDSLIAVQNKLRRPRNGFQSQQV